MSLHYVGDMFGGGVPDMNVGDIGISVFIRKYTIVYSI